MSVTFADIRAMLASAETLNLTATLKTPQDKGFTLSDEMLGAVTVLAACQSTPSPAIKHPRVALYASAYEMDNDKTQTRLQDLAEGKDAMLRLCGLVNADLRVYELDMTVMQQDEAAQAHALSYGLMAVDEHVDLLVLGSVSAAFENALTTWEKNMGSDPLKALTSSGVGQDIAAILGAALSARMAKVPVLCGVSLQKTLKKALAILLGDTQTGYILSLENAETKNWAGELQAMAALSALKTALALLPQNSNLVSLSQAA